MNSTIKTVAEAIETALLERLANGEVLDYKIDISENGICIMFVKDAPFKEESFDLVKGKFLN